MEKYKILCLGNEFIEQDSFAKKIAKELKKDGFEIIDIKDSFQLMDILRNSDEDEEFVILDVVAELKDVRIVSVDELTENKIITAHDFDASFVLKLFDDRKIRIIGIPLSGDSEKIKEKVKNLITYNLK